MAALGHLLGRLDPDPVRRGRQFERVCQWYLRHDPVYAHELRRVWLWDEWPGRWGIDAGVDLVAEDRRGQLWAIQAKAYGPATSITKHDVDTFLSESGRSEFSFRLLIATTNLIGRTAKRTIDAQEKQASVLLLGDLEAAEVDWPTSPSDLRARRLVPKRPKPHQREAMNAVVKGFDRDDRGQLIMACGTGKTLTALFINEKLAAARTLVLVPSLSLLAQTLREWTANTKTGFDFLPVCSDETVAEPDAAVENTSDLGFPVTTDPDEIASFLNDSFVNASRLGILGAALGGGAERAAQMSLYPNRLHAALTRSLVSSMRLDDKMIGMLVMGPPIGLINRFFGELPDVLRADVDEMRDLLWRLQIGVTKLHMVAISPDHRGRGHGSRLVRHAIDVARKSRIMLMYGEYGPDRPHLERFYTNLGFTILNDGQYLDLSFFTQVTFKTYPLHGETMFTRDI